MTLPLVALRWSAGSARTQIPGLRPRSGDGSPTSAERSAHSFRPTYSHFARATEATQMPYSLLDLTAMGRQEDWEEPKERADSLRPAQPDVAK